MPRTYKKCRFDEVQVGDIIPYFSHEHKQWEERQIEAVSSRTVHDGRTVVTLAFYNPEWCDETETGYLAAHAHTEIRIVLYP